MIRAFSHITIACSELGRSLGFYRTLGLRVTMDVGLVESEGVARAFALRAGRLRVVHLAPPDEPSAFVVDLVQWIDPPPDGAPPASLAALGLTRLALRVDDIDGTVRDLKSMGVEFLTGEAQAFGRGVRSIVARDPDGAFIQLIEGLDRMTPGWEGRRNDE